jgi:hypothetical protein
MQLIVRSLTTHVLDVSPDANVEVAMLVYIFCSSKFYLKFGTIAGSVPDPHIFGPHGS